jgi:hypothetical protein
MQTRGQVYSSTVKTQNEHGEIIESVSKDIVRIPKTPDFVMLFANTLGALEDLDKTSSKVLWGLLANKLVSRENLVSIDQNSKKFLVKKLNIKYDTITKAIKRLKEKKVIYVDEDGLSRLNPELFGKGDWSETYKLRMTKSYDFDFEENTMSTSKKVERLDKSAIGMDVKNTEIKSIDTNISTDEKSKEIVIEIQDKDIVEDHPNQELIDFDEKIIDLDIEEDKNRKKLIAVFGEKTVDTMSDEKIIQTLAMMGIA